MDESDITVVEWIDDPDIKSPERIAGLMRRLGDWYQAYCDWEDDQSHSLN